MKSKFVLEAGILAASVSAITLVAPAFADTTLQAFKCDSRGSVSIQSGTSKDKRYLIPGIDKVAVLVDASAQGPVGINYEFNPPIPFQFITWYYKEAQGSEALKSITVRYCTTRKDGSEQRSFDIDGGVSNRGGTVQDGWSNTIQDTRSTVPHYVLNGNGVIKKLTFIFKDKQNANNITLGRVEINQNPIAPTFITAVGSCDLKEKCTKDEK